MWIQLKQTRIIEKNGTLKTLCPGVWEDIGRQTALKWQSEGACYIPPAEINKSITLAPGSSGILVTHGDTKAAKEQLGGLAMEYETGDISMPWARTVIWDGQAAFRPALIATGLELLGTWEVAIPFAAGQDHNPILARDEGTEDERQATAAVIGDLRVPLYDVRLMFWRKCEATDRLLAAWKREGTNGNQRLSFMRALYRTPLLILALPVTWMGA